MLKRAALAAMVAAMAGAGVAAAQGVGCASCPLPLPDAPGVAQAPFSVTGCPVVESVAVAVLAQHSHRGDLVVQLEHDGQRVELWSNVGGRGSWFGVTIRDDAETPIANNVCGGLDPCAGTYAPELPGIPGQWGATGHRLGDFTGHLGNGAWALRIVDTAGGDVGTLIGASLSLTCLEALPSATPTQAATATPTPSRETTPTTAPATATPTRPSPAFLPLAVRDW